MGMESRAIQLHVEKQPAIMAISTQQGRLSLNSSPAQFDIESVAASVEVGSVKGVLYIDQYPSRYSYNIKNLTDLVSDAAQSGRQSALAAIGRIAVDGDQIAAKAKTGATVAAIAAQEAWPTPSQYDLVSITRPQIDYNLQRSEGYYQPGQFQNNSQPGRVDSSTPRSQIEISLSQNPSIRFSTTGSLDLRA